MDTFCVIPWVSKEINSHQIETHCCLLPREYDIEKIKNQMLEGKKPIECQQCWSIESTGKKSRRQFENEFLNYKLDRDLDKIQQDCAESKHQTLLYQISTSNLCNQACVSCNSTFSTKWAEVEKRMNIIPNPQYQLDLNTANINYSSAKRISLLGGEPLFDPKTFEILQKLIDNDNTDCFISLITNGSINLNFQQINLLKQFSDLNICISIDGIGPVFEYMRWPGKWNTLIANLDQYCSIAKNISASYTISSLNALYYDQTVAWFKQNNLDFNHNVISHPNWLSIKNMPVKFKQQLINKQNFIASFCNISGSEILVDIVSQHVRQQDQAKKIDIQDYMPEFWQLLKD
jgi:organic radical activating enzyme